MRFLIRPHPLTNFEIQKYYQNKRRFNSALTRNNLAKEIKDGAYIINFDEYANAGTHWIALFCNKNNIIYFPKKLKELLKNSLEIKT